MYADDTNLFNQPYNVSFFEIQIWNIRKFLNGFESLNKHKKTHVHFFIGFRIEATYTNAYQFSKLMIVT